MDDLKKDNTLENVRKARAELLRKTEMRLKELSRSADGAKNVLDEKASESSSAPPPPSSSSSSSSQNNKRARYEKEDNNTKYQKKKRKEKSIMRFSENTAWIEIQKSDDGERYYWNTLTDETRKKANLSEWKYAEDAVLVNGGEEDKNESSSSENDDDDGGSSSSSSSQSSDEEEEQQNVGEVGDKNKKETSTSSISFSLSSANKKDKFKTLIGFKPTGSK